VAHVFEPFYRADQARTRGGGTGLGLALAAAVVRVHGGRIAAGNGPLGGAQFDVVLPYSVTN
jgi:signal transduction histidine kinase